MSVRSSWRSSPPTSTRCWMLKATRPKLPMARVPMLAVPASPRQLQTRMRHPRAPMRLRRRPLHRRFARSTGRPTSPSSSPVWPEPPCSNVCCRSSAGWCSCCWSFVASVVADRLPQRLLRRVAITMDHDQVRVRELLGRQPQGSYDIVVRGPDGDPVVLRNAPFLDDGTPMPTRYWLIGPREVVAISRMESLGA